MLRRALVGVVLLGLAIAVSAATAAAEPREGFFGVVPQGELGPRDYERMRGTVGEIRIPLYWAQAEPRPGEFDFAGIDRMVKDAAAYGIRVMPFVLGSPAWLERDPAIPPLDTAVARRAWGQFLARLVRRYGPGGEIWVGARPAVPIRRWQIWNEPNFPIFWHPKPEPSRYARLLRLSAEAIRREDPDARIVAAGVAPIEGEEPPWEFLRRMYRVPGVKGYFDVAALHPYSTRLRTMEYEIRHTRRAMARGGDAGTPLQLTELGVASGGSFPNPFDKGPRGQARFLRRAYRLLGENRVRWRLGGVDWFAWQDGPRPDPFCVFCQYAGLVDLDGAAKPAWWAFRSAVAEAGSRPVR